MSKRFDVKFNPQLRPIIEKALENKKVKDLLICHNLNENSQGVVHVAVYEFLEELGLVHHLKKRNKE